MIVQSRCGRCGAEVAVALSSATEGQCHWREVRSVWDDTFWETECGNAALWDGKPGEHQQRFCGYCGKRLVEVPYVEPDEEADDE